MVLLKKQDIAKTQLCNSIADTYSALANICPQTALEVLNQLNEQMNQELCDELTEQTDAFIEGKTNE